MHKVGISMRAADDRTDGRTTRDTRASWATTASSAKQRNTDETQTRDTSTTADWLPWRRGVRCGQEGGRWQRRHWLVWRSVAGAASPSRPPSLRVLRVRSSLLLVVL